jgi:hypothetical protein
MLRVLRNGSASESFDALRAISQHTNVKLHDVAATAGREQPPLPALVIVDKVLEEVRRAVLCQPITLPNGKRSRKPLGRTSATANLKWRPFRPRYCRGRVGRSPAEKEHAMSWRTTFTELVPVIEVESNAR